MQHLLLFYFILSLMTGTITLILGIILFVKTREIVISKFIYIFTILSIKLIASIAFAYILLNINNPPQNIIHILLFVNIFSFALLAHAIFLISHHGVNYGFKLPITILVYFACIIMGILSLFSYSVDFETEIITILSPIIILSVLFIAIYSYCIIIDIIFFKKSTSFFSRKILKNTIIIVQIVFLPGIVYDFVQSIIHPEIHMKGAVSLLVFFPALYIALSILYTWFFLLNFSLKEPVKDIAYLEKNLFTQYKISQREKEIIRLILNGKSNKEIAYDLHISLSTIKTHITSIFCKMNINSRYELILFVTQGHNYSGLK